MQIELLMEEDLARFKTELFERLKELHSSEPQSKWLRSKDVRKLLGGISDSTLQSLRVSKSIPSYKLGNSWYYKYDEIIDALEAGKITRKETKND